MAGSGLPIAFLNRPFAVNRAPHFVHVCVPCGVNARGPSSNTGVEHSVQSIAATRFLSECSVLWAINTRTIWGLSFTPSIVTEE